VVLSLRSWPFPFCSTFLFSKKLKIFFFFARSNYGLTTSFQTSKWCKVQRPILNIARRVKLWPPRAKLSPRGKFCPLGVKLSPGGMKFTFCPSILLNNRECSPLVVNEGVTFPPGDKFHPWGPSSPLGANGANHDVKNWPLEWQEMSTKGLEIGRHNDFFWGQCYDHYLFLAISNTFQQ
jgi:hypothetical protein